MHQDQERMPRFKFKALFYVIFIISIILGLLLRFESLDSRPMHTDEAIQAWRLGSMIEGEGFNYRPDDGHGPVLLFLSMPIVWIKSINNYQELNEVILRSVTAVGGTLLIIMMLLFKRLISIQGVAISSALVALSPMHVYYSRYYIMETPMLLFLALFLFFSWKYFQQQKYYWMLGAGFACGVMHATKETFVISVASIVIAATIIFLIEELRKNYVARLKPKKLVLNFCFGLIVMFFTSAALFTVFFNNLEAIKDSYTSYSDYLSRAEGSGHEKPFLYYINLISWKEMELYSWSELATIILAVVGIFSSFFLQKKTTKEIIFLRVLSLYTIINLLIYSLIPYKTPWSILPFLQAAIILAGFGFFSLYQLGEKMKRIRTFYQSILIISFIGICINYNNQNKNSLKSPANSDRNPYVYNHTSPSLVSKLVKQTIFELKDIKDDLSINVFHPETGWPLPYYFRDIKNCGYYPEVQENLSSDVIIADAEYDEDISNMVGNNYIGPDLMNLRDNVMLHVYIEKELFYQMVERRPVNN